PRDIDVLRARRGGAAGSDAAGTSQSLLAGPAGSAPGTAPTGDAGGIYSLRGVYFSPQQFSSTADCLTATSAQGLPLD
ncbi:hypothetical protein, partial [Klebsiella pneumoniae]|uniref:hypothetical protein n=1 Tax=Klebsiella pneumoniae TaxID=573 RepID=UPI003012A3DD